MSNEWRDITDPKELFSLDLSEWEIHRYHDRTEEWYGWHGSDWQYSQRFRARRRQTKTKKLKIYGYLDTVTGRTFTVVRGMSISGDAVPYPKLDDEIEVEA